MLLSGVIRKINKNSISLINSTFNRFKKLGHKNDLWYIESPSTIKKGKITLSNCKAAMPGMHGEKYGRGAYEIY